MNKNLFLMGFWQCRANLISWRFLVFSKPEYVPFWNRLFFSYLVIR